MKKTLDWKQYEQKARQAIAEGCVLLKNDNQTLPLKKDCTVSIFGRIQSSYYKSGTGSGGMVNVSKVYNLVEGLEESGWVKINKDLQKIYAEWEEKNPFDEGLGWGHDRWSQDEMPLTDQIVSQAAAQSDVAIIIIGRTAGEDKDNKDEEGAYRLTKIEEEMMEKVRKGFKKVLVLLNVGNIINMSFVKKYQPDAVMYVWQGGMLGGLGTADVLTGKVSPCGKLPDTIAQDISDYPSDKNFGNPEQNIYQEDIFVGYRYFESFARDKVLYPFGFGLSYSNFEITCKNAVNSLEKQKIDCQILVKNTGKSEGKEVVQLYIQAPDGKLGKADRVMVDFEKTQTLSPSQEEKLEFSIPYYNFASYDDSGASGHKSAWLLEAGTYNLYAGSDVRSAQKILEFSLNQNLVIKECEEALAPVQSFERWHKAGDSIIMEKTPIRSKAMADRRSESLPQEIKQTGKVLYKLEDVINGKVSLEDFTAQLDDEDLACLVRGEGMGSSLVTPGTASAYGGVSPRLKNYFGIATACCDDGPSGMRLDSGAKAFSLPNGTSLACTFNRQLVKELYSFTGLEMQSNKVDNLLGPGMNIHRHPLNGRNFEYFSEDPYLTGEMATAMLQGLWSQGVTGTIKHFCGNNQETNRRNHNSVISERALREIYLKGFEIAVANGADSVMTTYGLVNGVYTAGSYDLNTTILRKEWGFKGIVMTDWWANISEEKVEPNPHNFAGMIKAQNDLYMCCSSGATNKDGDNTIEALKDGRLTRGELQRSAMNVCEQVMKMPAMKRLMGCADVVEIINRPKSPDDVNMDDIEFKVISKDKELELDLTYQESKAKTNYTLAFDVSDLGTYEVSLTGSSDLGPLAQIPLTIFFQGFPVASFTFNGTDGKDVTLTKKLIFPTRFCVNRLYVASNGVKLKSLKLKYISSKADSADIGFDN
ncbi:MAG: glycoside hydrolase family 3 C-terminal domain-containing protein [Treponema sp.]|nr:glycoside hydrolase family 3 C-terminal domain-containing protein [Treponema sp.]